MKITKQYLTQVIKEEIDNILHEESSTSPVKKKIYTDDGGVFEWESPEDWDNAGGFRGNPGRDRMLADIIKQSDTPDVALKKIKEAKSVTMEVALAYFVIAHKHLKSNVPGSSEPYAAYTDKFMQKPMKDGEKFDPYDYIIRDRTGYSSERNQFIFAKMYPKLWEQISKMDEPYMNAHGDFQRYQLKKYNRQGGDLDMSEPYGVRVPKMLKREKDARERNIK